MDPRIEKLSVRTALRCILDLVMPRVCCVCGRELLPQEEDLCTVCRADIPLTRYASRSHNPMADLLNARIQERDSFPEMYAYAAALFFYAPESPYSALTQKLKYNGATGMGRRISALLAAELAASPLYADVDLVIPVPLHRSRRWKRGYNQAEVIAREIAAALGSRLDTRILRRVRKTRSQTGVSPDAKARNVAGAFVASLPGAPSGPACGSGPGSDSCAPGAPSGPACGPGPGADSCAPALPRHILLVDDVFTTGATLSECHAALRRVFPPSVRISAATLAFVSGAH